MKNLIKTFSALYFGLSIQICFAQSIEHKEMYRENFESPTSQWVEVDDGYSTIVKSGKYICNLPINNSLGWNWTWVSFPNDLDKIFNQYSDLALSFDVTLENKSYYPSFGILFDLHNVTNKCEGGDFYEINFSGNKLNNNLLTQFWKLEKCQRKVAFHKEGESIPMGTNLHVDILKTGYNWRVVVNNVQTLDVNLSGKITLDKLKFGQGTYSFDNFTIRTNTLIIDKSKSIGNTSNSLRPTIWALCIGIEDYSKFPGLGCDKGHCNLNYSIDDAEAYAGFLKSDQGGKIPEKQVLLLNDQNASEDNILKSISNHFSNAKDDDLIILYLSGHGNNGFFCASDKPVRYEYINALLETSKAKRKILIADACYSGSWASSENVFRPKGKILTKEESMNLFYSELQKSSKTVSYILAAQPDEVSWEDDNRKHGIFSYYLNEGLNCKADINADKIITLEEIAKYLQINVSVYYVGKTFVDNDNLYKPMPAQNPVLKTNDPKTPLAVCTN